MERVTRGPMATKRTKAAKGRPSAPAKAKPKAKPTAKAKPAAKAKAKADPARSLALYRALVGAHPDAHCELEHRSPFELLVATVLSAQSTDVVVNRVTPGLFAAYPGPRELAQAAPADVERLIGKLGMFRQKTKSLIGLSRALLSDHGGAVPRTLGELVRLPGVGRKTANVVLGVAFRTPEGVVVDTHVGRLAQRLGFSRHAEPEKVERDLMALLPREEWDRASHTLIFHGRRICSAQRPACASCPVHATCPSAFHAEQVGRKPARQRS